MPGLFGKSLESDSVCKLRGGEMYSLYKNTNTHIVKPEQVKQPLHLIQELDPESPTEGSPTSHAPPFTSPNPCVSLGGRRERVSDGNVTFSPAGSHLPHPSQLQAGILKKGESGKGGSPFGRDGTDLHHRLPQRTC